MISEKEQGRDESSTDSEVTEAYLQLPIPVPDSDLFRYGATTDILDVLVSDASEGYTHRELSRATDYSVNAVNQAIGVLKEIGWVTTESTGPGEEVRINTDVLHRPKDPVAVVPQPEFHEPVRALREEILDRLTHVLGVVLFGSVATGDADRKSDVDVFVLVDDDQPKNQRRAHDIENEFEDRRFDDERYTPHLLVESPKTLQLSEDEYRDVLREGIVLHSTDEFDRIRHSVLAWPATDDEK